MTNSISLKKKALILRQQGKSYGEINKIIGVSKSTLSTWLKLIPISKKVKNQNIQRAKSIWAKNITQYNKKRATKYREETNRLINNFSKEVPLLDKKSLFWLGLGLFWAEGGKKEKWSVRLINSDPEVIKTAMRFFREICKVQDSKFRFRIYLHPNIIDSEAKKYWTNLLNLPENQFYKSQKTISIASKGKRRYNQLPNGTLHIYINDALLSKRLKGWMKGLIKQINMPG
jgi:hypothetical protein